MKTLAPLLVCLDLLAPPARAGKVCQTYSEPAPPTLPRCGLDQGFHQSDTVYEVLRNGLQFEAQFIDEGWAGQFVDGRLHVAIVIAIPGIIEEAYRVMRLSIPAQNA